MKHLICVFLFFVYSLHLSRAQSSFGLGGGLLLNKSYMDIGGMMYINYNIVNLNPKFTGQIFYNYTINERYQREVQVSYREFSIDRNYWSGDYAGTIDTSNFTFRNIDFINYHQFHPFNKIPVYLKFGFNLTCNAEVYHNYKTAYYDFGPGGTFDDSSIYFIHEAVTNYKPKTWSFGFSGGLLFSQPVTDYLSVRLELLYYNQIILPKNLENIYSKSMIINCGISYDLKNPIIPKKNNPRDSIRSVRTNKNVVNLAFSLNPLNIQNEDYALQINYLRQLEGKNIYLGGGLTGYKSNSYPFFAENFVHLSSEYRPVKFISIGFYPGLHSSKSSLYDWSHMPGADAVLNFPFSLNELEISPFGQVEYRLFNDNIQFYCGLKIGVRF